MAFRYSFRQRKIPLVASKITLDDLPEGVDRVSWQTVTGDYDAHRVDNVPPVVAVTGRTDKLITAALLAIRAHRRGAEVYHEGQFWFGSTVDIRRLLVLADQVTPSSLVYLDDAADYSMDMDDCPDWLKILDTALASFGERGIQVVVSTNNIDMLHPPLLRVVQSAITPERTGSSGHKLPPWCYITLHRQDYAMRIFDKQPNPVMARLDPAEVLRAGKLINPEADRPEGMTPAELEDLFTMYNSLKDVRG